MKNLVIDKSFLQGVSKKRICELSQSYNILMPRSLFFELLKQTPIERAKLFKKFDIQKKYQLLPTFGEIFSQELKSGNKIIPSDLIKSRSYSIHENLCDDNFKFTEEQNDGIQQLKEDINLLSVLFLNVIEDFMEGKIDFNEKDIDKNEKLVKLYITKLNQYYKNNINKFDSSSFVYNWTLVLHLFAKDLSIRYENINIIRESENAKEKIRHDILDMEYLVFSIMENNFATKERKLIDWFNQLSKNGTCIVD